MWEQYLEIAVNMTQAYWPLLGTVMLVLVIPLMIFRVGRHGQLAAKGVKQLNAKVEELQTTLERTISMPPLSKLRRSGKLKRFLKPLPKPVRKKVHLRRSRLKFMRKMQPRHGRNFLLMGTWLWSSRIFLRPKMSRSLPLRFSPKLNLNRHPPQRL